jgi:hypothetical protein
MASSSLKIILCSRKSLSRNDAVKILVAAQPHRLRFGAPSRRTRAPVWVARARPTAPGAGELGIGVLEMKNGWQTAGRLSHASDFLPKYTKRWSDIRAAR